MLIEDGAALSRVVDYIHLNPPVLVSADGAVAEGGYPWAPSLNGGFTVLELPLRNEGVAGAARIAMACRCNQELRVFQFYPAS